MLKAAVPTLLFVLPAAIAGAQPFAMTMTAYPGRCHSLIVFDRPEHRRCADSIAAIALDDGRSGYGFTLTDGTIVTFTAPASGRTTAGGKTTLAVDHVNFVYRSEGSAIPAVGTCEAGDPKVWRASNQMQSEHGERPSRRRLLVNRGRWDADLQQHVQTMKHSFVVVLTAVMVFAGHAFAARTSPELVSRATSM